MSTSNLYSTIYGAMRLAERQVNQTIQINQEEKKKIKEIAIPQKAVKHLPCHEIARP